ncbi:MAG: hypothetical protein ABI551_18750 [Polyangiaceae bacterium]
MPVKRLRPVGALVALSLLAAAADARAADPGPTKQQCVTANESAQSLRQSGKLREARAQLLVCVAKACPGPVREDCAQRLNEVETATPTIVFVAKDAAGNDLTAVRVKMDGASLAPSLDGSALAVEPGEHTFQLAAAGFPDITKKLVLHEGEKNRNESITFGAPVAVAPAPVPVTSTPAPPVRMPDDQGSTRGNGQRVVGLIVGGVGLAGVGVGAVFGLVASGTYHDAQTHCPTSTTCDADGVSGGSSAHTQASISTIAFIAGGALVAGGVVLYLTAPKHGGVSVQTSAGPGAVGLRLGGTF